MTLFSYLPASRLLTRRTWDHEADFAGGLVRLDSNGTLDTSFGSVDSFGICCSVTTDQTVTGLLIQTDGNTVVIGGLDGDLAVARYLAN